MFSIFNRIICTIFLVSSLIITSAIGQKKSNSDSVKVIGLNNGITLRFYDYKNPYWQRMQLIQNGIKREVISLFNLSDSKVYDLTDNRYLSLEKSRIYTNALETGLVEDEDTSFIHEVAGCKLINLQTACVEKIMGGSSCVGEWSNKVDEIWITEGVEIDLRYDNELVTYYEEIKLESLNNKFLTLNDKFPTIEVISKVLSCYPIRKETVIIYNDLAYFFEKNKNFKSAVYILENLVRTHPDRAVAYLNLGDAYFGLKNTPKAKGAYTTYIQLMKKSGKQAKIPKRVYDRLK